jgi:hypothetical protein
MARPLRIEFAGALYHLTSRGNEQRPIYRSDRDRMAFSSRRPSRSTVWMVAHGMGTDAELLPSRLIWTSEPNLSRLE